MANNPLIAYLYLISIIFSLMLGCRFKFRLKKSTLICNIYVTCWTIGLMHHDWSVVSPRTMICPGIDLDPTLEPMHIGVCLYPLSATNLNTLHILIIEHMGRPTPHDSMMVGIWILHLPLWLWVGRGFVSWTFKCWCDHGNSWWPWYSCY